ncbi:MAG: prenyltransferase/squalene oxidase repeat-containing protein [Phycisphaerales bacterium]
MVRTLSAIVVAAAALVPAAFTLALAEAVKADDTQARAAAIAGKAIAYLRGQQDAATGGWSIPKEGPVFPAITGLVLTGMLAEPGLKADDAAVAKGVTFILSKQQPDGGIYDTVLPSYNTAICISALAKAGTPEATAAVSRAVAFLRTLQYGEAAMTSGKFAGETAKIGKEHPFYGGVGYGRSGRPDASNLHWFMQALADAGVPSDDEAVQRALVFLSRVQMLDAINDRPYADGSSQGGFIYSVGQSKDAMDVGQSYGGEAAESLSGPPGTVARVVLRTDGGKEHTLTRDEVRRMIGEVAEVSKYPEIRGLKTDAIILLGASSDGLASHSFEIRTPVRSAEDLREFLFASLAGDVAERGAIRVEAVEHWQGASRLRCYGSMTYAGFKSLVYANLSADDPRVRAAYGWIQRHYTLEENPNVGTDGLYYYFVTFARALEAWRRTGPTRDAARRIVTYAAGDEGGTERDWAKDLVDRLEKLQNSDGSFKSVDDRWMENNPVLITAYALIAVQHVRQK